MFKKSISVIASVSKTIHRAARVDCFVARAPLRKRFAFVAGNGDDTWVLILAACCARGLPLFSAPPKTKGARRCRAHGAPAVSCAVLPRKAHTSIQVHRNHPASPHAMA